MASIVGGSTALFKAPHEQVAHHGSPAASPLGLASATFSGMPAHSSAVTTHTHEGNTVVQLHDGSTLTVVGTSHISASFMHHS